jgi:hypothetical protein
MSTADHATTLAEHSAAIEALRVGQDELRKGVQAVAGKLDAIASAVHEIRGAAGPSMRDMMDVGSRAIMIFGALVAGIVYLSRGGNTEDLHALDVRMTRVEMIIGLAAQSKRMPTGMVFGRATD